MPKWQTIVSLFLRNLFFTVLQPGIVAGLIPYLILGERVQNINAHTWGPLQYAGFILWIAGLGLLLVCIANFVMYGLGTLSPADPTKKLVITGPYRLSRNPMYVGVILMLLGETIFFLSIISGLYTVLTGSVFYAFVTLKEEPRLQKDFGEAYTRYCQSVGRWI